MLFCYLFLIFIYNKNIDSILVLISQFGIQFIYKINEHAIKKLKNIKYKLNKF